MALSLNDNGAVYQDPSGNGDFTDISFFGFIKVSSLGISQSIFTNGHGGSFGQGYRFNIHSGNTLRIDINYVASINSTFAIPDTTGYHFVGLQRRASDSKWLIYMDSATPQELGTNNPYGNDSNAGMVVGGSMLNGTITPDFQGLIARAGYWDRLLTSTEIGDLLDGSITPQSLTTNLLFALPFVDGDLLNNDSGSLGDFTQNGTLTYSSDEPFSGASTSVKDLIGGGFIPFSR